MIYIYNELAPNYFLIDNPDTQRVKNKLNLLNELKVQKHKLSIADEERNQRDLFNELTKSKPSSAPMKRKKKFADNSSLKRTKLCRSKLDYESSKAIQEKKYYVSEK